MSRALEATSDSANLDAFVDCFVDSFQISMSKEDSAFAIALVTCIFGIHPSHWTVLGNLATFDEGRFTDCINQLLRQLHAVLDCHNES